MHPTDFPKLFEPATIGGVRLRNRLVMLPMGIAYASAIGEVTQKTIDYYAERARGGVGMITVGGVSPFGRLNLNTPLLNADWFMAGHYELVEAVHAEGAAICAQLFHTGRAQYPWVLEGRQPVSASDVTCLYLGEYTYPKPRPLEIHEIYEMMDKWAEAAGRAKKVGYDFVELHACHGYLIEQFMSPFTNKRTDEFGGSLENRMRFPLELLRRVRKVVGEKYPVGFRLGAEEFVEGGITIKDSPVMAKMLEEGGAAYVSVTCGIRETHDKAMDTMAAKEGWKQYIWEAIKAAINIPVIIGGGLRTPAYCESLLANGSGDFIGLARPLLADPHWLDKVREGKIDDICPCISCLECLHGSTRRRQGGGARRCSVNPSAGREREFMELKRAAVKKKVLVVGGGPAGMEAARIASLRGHKVTLYDRGAELGGAMLLAGAPPGKEKINWFRDYLKTQVGKAGVEVRLGAEVTADLVKKEKPDAVIIAAGGQPINPYQQIRNVVTAWEVLSGKADISGKTVIVVGGGMVGVETATWLVDRGNRVTIVEMMPVMAADMESNNRYVTLRELKEASVVTLTGKKVVEVTEKGVSVVDNGETSFLEGDVIVVAVGAKPAQDLVANLEGKVPELYAIGDCVEPRIIMEAMYEGSRAGRRV